MLNRALRRAVSGSVPGVGDDRGSPGVEQEPAPAGEPGLRLVSAVARLPRASPRVLLIERDDLAASFLETMLEAGNAVVLARCTSGREGARIARLNSPDIVFVDRVTSLVEAAGTVELIAELVGFGLGIRVVVLATRWDIDEAIAVIRAGAHGCVSKHDLLSFGPRGVLRAVMSDQLVGSRSLSSAVLERLIEQPLTAVGQRPVRSCLTRREWEILDLICLRRSSDCIAGELSITLETVRTHVNNMRRKLGVSSRAELIAAAPALRNSDPV